MTANANSDNPLLEFIGVHAHYGPVEALKSVNVHIAKGEIVSLIGANGAGKTTLLSTIFGAPRASSGKVMHKGEDISLLPTNRISRRGIALVPEGRQIYPDMSVEENMMMGTTPIGTTHFDEDRTQMFELFPRLKERWRSRAP
ncbi:ABC-type branched-subunit amino acid transport system ATPase component [Pararhizobium capsulatum DSM 1112]|uniref:ABC-type branched-subunit amino acid transport system ATPase component n=1 Tax=Pararhizobium capsulatum DSM 1112 TaxID=1121113 RepID=A0ABU0BJ44_9HYPH|nr:ABC-type branched-subunit amino acid transport system ATPase component [Pararhizobium capsulatum DSM 1112]